jgi:2'-5' RNA ligase
MGQRPSGRSRDDGDDQIRGFVAILLPDDVRAYCEDQMAALRRGLGPAERAVRWVGPEGLHLTLKFLGNVPNAQLPDLTERLAVEMAGQSPFDLGIGRLGAFPNMRAPRVIVLATTGHLAALASAKERVEVATEPLGYLRERRSFRPHYTLGRVREGAAQADLAALARIIPNQTAEVGPTFRVTSVRLMRSLIGPGGAKYRRVEEFPFQG